jgi:hypothetical protein
VRAEIERDPAAATRPDPRTGWTPLHAVCASRWHYLDPARAPGLLATARLLLDAGAIAEDSDLFLAGFSDDDHRCLRLLPDRGAGLQARDTTWHSTPLTWAIVGSGGRPRSTPRPDWAATVRILLQAGAATAGMELSPGDRKAPGPQVADILRGAGCRIVIPQAVLLNEPRGGAGGRSWSGGRRRTPSASAEFLVIGL